MPPQEPAPAPIPQPTALPSESFDAAPLLGAAAPTAQAALPEPSEDHPSYTLLRHLGGGGAGDVLLARDRIGRSVAMKVIRRTDALDGAAMARLEREARVLGQINSLRVARVYVFHPPRGIRRRDVVVAEGLDPGWIDRVVESPVIVMEHVDGRTLHAALQERRRSVAWGLRIGYGIAMALLKLHRNRPPVHHRDLKPLNIMLPGRGPLKVVDMGLARIVDAQAAAGAAARAEGLTIAYASPEQLRREPLDHRSDIWSFGAVLFECLAGRAPFAGKDHEERIAAILFDAPPLDLLPRGVPESVRSLVGACLEKDRTRRPASIADAVKVLRPWAHGLGRVPSNLPPDWTASPTGRERLVETVVRELQSGRSRLLCLHGLAGVGKSRIAAAAARRIAAGRAGRRPWIIAWVAPPPRQGPQRESTWALQAIAALRSIGRGADRIAAEPTPAEAMRVLTGVLRRRPALLVFDGLDEPGDSFSRFASHLRDAAPETTLLVTSLEPTALPDQALVPVDPLGLPATGLEDAAAIGRSPAVALFVEIAQRAPTPHRFELTSRNAQSVARICRALGGMPMAIEWAASHIETIPPEEIERRLAELLGEDEQADRDGAFASRPRSLRAAMALSIGDLGEPERTLLARLSVFPADFSLAAAEAICADDPTSDQAAGRARIDGVPLLQLLVRLVRRRLVRRVGERYRHHEPVRAFARSLRIDDAEQRRLERRFSAHFDALIARGLPEQLGSDADSIGRWLGEVEADLENIRQALALAETAPDGAVRLAEHVRALEYFWWQRGPIHDSGAWCDRALARIDEIASPFERIRLLSASATVLTRIGRYEETESLYRRALAECDAHPGLERGRTFIKTNLAVFWRMRNRFGEAELAATEAIDSYAALGLPQLDAQVRAIIAVVRKIGGDLDEAARLYRELEGRFLEANDHVRWLDARRNLAEIAVAQGRIAEALPILRSTWRAHRGRSRLERLRAATWMGIAHALGGDRHRARRLLDAVAPAWRTVAGSSRDPWIDEWIERARGALRAPSG